MTTVAKMVAVKSIRWIATACPLWIVWHHAHWSVALMLTFQCVANEIGAWIYTTKGYEL